MEVWTLAFVVIVCLVLAALYVAASRAITIVELEIRKGAIDVVRGGVAPPILADLRDVAKGSFGLPAIDGVRLRVVRSSGAAEMQVVKGTLSPEHAQQIRNVIGSVPLARLINTIHKKR